jgi:hypothetical protein
MAVNMEFFGGDRQPGPVPVPLNRATRPAACGRDERRQRPKEDRKGRRTGSEAREPDDAVTAREYSCRVYSCGV